MGLSGCSDSGSSLIKNFSASTASLTVNRAKEIGLLNATEDLYDGVTVEMKEPMESEVFVSLLRASMSKWRQQVLSLYHIPPSPIFYDPANFKLNLNFGYVFL